MAATCPSNFFPLTGAIKIAMSEPGFSPSHAFDREKSDFHYLTVEARDELGEGNRNTVELLLHLVDVNDNAPVFRRDSYESSIAENEDRFALPFVVSADDKDENGTENAEVRYRIVRGKNAGNFTIDSVSGELRPNGLIDYELVPPSADGETRKFELTVRAADLGDPPRHSDVPVTVYVTDRNDHAPVFERSHYRVGIDEDAPGGTPVLQVKAFDGDGSSPNNDVVFRLRSGAKDKFVIDAETGVISVSQGANLDPDQSVPRSFSYLIEVAAIDGGLGDTRLTGTATVNVTVRDVNNKPPYFDYPSMSLSILENVSVGTFVTSVTARDPDKKATLRYSLDPASSVATSESGRTASSKEFEVSDVFALNTRTGELRVQGKLDREAVSQIKLVVVARDIAADGGDQTASVVLGKNASFILFHFKRCNLIFQLQISQWRTKTTITRASRSPLTRRPCQKTVPLEPEYCRCRRRTRT